MRLIGSASSILRRSTRTLRARQISSAMSVGVTDPKSAPVGPARADDPPRADLALLGDVAAKLVVVLVVDLLDLVLAEEAALAAGGAGRGRRALPAGLVAVFQLRHASPP